MSARTLSTTARNCGDASGAIVTGTVLVAPGVPATAVPDVGADALAAALVGTGIDVDVGATGVTVIVGAAGGEGTTVAGDAGDAATVGCPVGVVGAGAVGVAVGVPLLQAESTAEAAAAAVMVRKCRRPNRAGVCWEQSTSLSPSSHTRTRLTGLYSMGLSPHYDT
jgi:hypothetical protein